MSKGIGGHTKAYRGATDNWITPPYIFEALGQFDLDPCACRPQPWPCATASYDRNGLLQLWTNRIWLNPPYGPNAEPFLKKLAEHSNGIALLFARTETKMFHKYIWNKAGALLFLKGRLHFYYPNGERAKGNAGGPSVLIAYGSKNVSILGRSNLRGAFVKL